MRRNGLAAIAAVAALASGVPAQAQSWRADLGLNAGGSYYTPMLSSSTFTAGDAVKFGTHWLLGAQAGLWFTPRVGIRANGTYTDAPLKSGSQVLFDDVNLWSLTGDLLFRFKQPPPTFTGPEFLPYLALGAGAKWINPAGEGFVASAADGTNKTGAPFVCGSAIQPAGGAHCAGPAVGDGANFFLTKSTRFMGLVGLGGDLRLARSFALRLEIGDRLYKPQVWPVAPVTTGLGPGGFIAAPTSVSATSTENQSKLVHELYGQVGLHLLLGAGESAVAATPPPPAPPPPPPPPPAPTTVTSSVCVVDPVAPGGLATEPVTINTTTNDTTVVVNGQTVALGTAFAGVPVAARAPWYVQGRPLTIGTGRNELAYVSFGAVRNVNMGDLTIVGTVDGLPVYVNRADAATLTVPMPPGEVTNSPALLTGLRRVQVLYVPLTPYGCNVQPMQLQQAVRKVTG